MEETITISKSQYKKLLKGSKVALVVDLILLCLFIAIAIYLFKNIEWIKHLAGNYCKMCVEKSGATCFKL